MGSVCPDTRNVDEGKKRKKRNKKRSRDAGQPDSAHGGTRGVRDVNDDKRVVRKHRKRSNNGQSAYGQENGNTVDVSAKASSNWERLRETLHSGSRKTLRGGELQIHIASSPNGDCSHARGNLTKVLALDCEMVGGGVGGQMSLLARVSIVNASGDVVYDTFVSPTERVTDYRTQWSGIRPNDLAGAPSKERVVEQVRSLLAGRIIVGHSLKNDLDVLDIAHPESHVRDSAKYPQFMRRLICGRLKPKALRHIVAEELDLSIQTGEHDSVQDARAVLGLYQKHKGPWELWHSKEMKRLKKRRKS